MTDFEVVGRIVVDDKGTSQIQASKSALDQLSSSGDAVGGVFQNLGGIADFVFANLIVEGINTALSAIKEFASDVMEKAMGLQDIEAQLNAVLASTGGVAGMTKDAVEGLAQKFAETTKFGAALTEKAETIMLQFTRIGKEIFPGAMNAAADLASRLGIDLPAAASMVAKALGDPADGIGRLNTAYKLFSKEQLKAIEEMAKHGKVAEAQKLILEALGKAVGGAAAAAAETFSGKLAILKNKLEEMYEKIGNRVLPVLGQLADKISPYIDKYLPMFADLLVNDVGPAVDKVARFVGDLIDMLGAGEDPLSALSESLALTFRGTPLGEFGKQLYQVGQQLTTLVQQGFQQLSDWWKRNGPSLQTAAQTLFGGIKTLIADLAQKVGPFLVAEFQKIGAWFVENGPLISKFANVIAEAFTRYIVPAITNAWDIIEPLLDGLISVILGIAKTIMQVATGDWRGAWETIKGVVGTALGSVMQSVYNMLNWFPAIMGTTLPHVLQVWQDNLNQIANIANGLGDKIGAAFAGIAASLSGQVNGWISTLNGMLGPFEAFGENLMSSIGDGIKKMASYAINAGISAVNQIIAAIRNALSSFSPSRKGIELGGTLPQGLALGIEKMAHLPIQAMRNLTGGMLGVPAMAGASYNTTYANQSSATNNYYLGPNLYNPRKDNQGQSAMQLFRKS